MYVCMFFQTFTAKSVMLLDVTVQRMDTPQSRPATVAPGAFFVIRAAVSILYLCGSGSESGNESVSVADPDSDQDPDSNPAHLMYCI